MSRTTTIVGQHDPPPLRVDSEFKPTVVVRKVENRKGRFHHRVFRRQCLLQRTTKINNLNIRYILLKFVELPSLVKNVRLRVFLRESRFISSIIDCEELVTVYGDRVHEVPLIPKIESVESHSTIEIIEVHSSTSVSLHLWNRLR